MKVTSGAFEKILSAMAVSARPIVAAYVAISSSIYWSSDVVSADRGSVKPSASRASAQRETGVFVRYIPSSFCVVVSDGLAPIGAVQLGEQRTALWRTLNEI
jgi:hypothetical protein